MLLYGLAHSSGSSTTLACTALLALYFVAGFEWRGGRVSRTAPIINYMLGLVTRARAFILPWEKNGFADWIE